MMGLPGALVVKGRRHEDKEEGTDRFLLGSFQPDPRQTVGAQAQTHECSWQDPACVTHPCNLEKGNSSGQTFLSSSPRGQPGELSTGVDMTG